jgi:hypothetical protein
VSSRYEPDGVRDTILATARDTVSATVRELATGRDGLAFGDQIPLWEVSTDVAQEAARRLAPLESGSTEI